MGRVAATAVHLALCAVAGVLYFLFVLPRWWELMGDTSHTLGTVLRIVTGILIALAALPVLLTLLRTRRAEQATPELAEKLRIGSIVGHVLAGFLIVATAISEIWLSLDTAGPWLFGSYGAAAAIAILGILAFYLAFVAEQPPAPPKPAKPKKVRKKRGKKADAAAESADTTDSDETAGSEETTEADETAGSESGEQAEPQDGEVGADEKPAEVTAKVETEDKTSADSEATADDAGTGGLRNKRPSGKTSHRLRRSVRGSIAVED